MIDTCVLLPVMNHIMKQVRCCSHWNNPRGKKYPGIVSINCFRSRAEIIGGVVSRRRPRLSIQKTWWRHQIETFSALLAICAGNSPVSGEFPAQRPVTRSFDVFCDLRLNKRFSKQSWGWWFETLPRPLWRHSNAHQVHVDINMCIHIGVWCVNNNAW